MASKRRNRFRTAVYQSGLVDKILKRDGYRCTYCGIPLITVIQIYELRDDHRQQYLNQYLGKEITYEEYLAITDDQIIFKELYNENRHRLATIDHVIPIIAGGSDEESNLISACMACNCKKGTKQKS